MLDKKKVPKNFTPNETFSSTDQTQTVYILPTIDTK